VLFLTINLRLVCGKVNPKFCRYTLKGLNLFTNKVKILKEIKRLVKKDGKIIIGVYSEKASVIRLKQYRKAGAYLKKINKDGTFLLRDGTISEQFSPIKLKRIFKKAGLIPKLTTLGKFAYICEAKK